MVRRGSGVYSGIEGEVRETREVRKADDAMIKVKRKDPDSRG